MNRLYVPCLLLAAGAAGCSRGGPEVRDLEIPQLHVRLRVASSPLDIDYVRAETPPPELDSPEAPALDGTEPIAAAPAAAAAPSPAPADEAAATAAPPTNPLEQGELSRVDITVHGLRKCKLSLYPRGEELGFDERIAAAERSLEGIARRFRTWHRKEQRPGGWALDYEVAENGRVVRTVSHRVDLGGRVFTCESGRLLASREVGRCAEAVDAACATLAAL